MNKIETTIETAIETTIIIKPYFDINGLTLRLYIETTNKIETYIDIPIDDLFTNTIQGIIRQINLEYIISDKTLETSLNDIYSSFLKLTGILLEGNQRFQNFQQYINKIKNEIKNEIRDNKITNLEELDKIVDKINLISKNDLF